MVSAYVLRRLLEPGGGWKAIHPRAGEPFDTSGGWVGGAAHSAVAEGGSGQCRHFGGLDGLAHFQADFFYLYRFECLNALGQQASTRAARMFA